MQSHSKNEIQHNLCLCDDINSLLFVSVNSVIW